MHRAALIACLLLLGCKDKTAGKQPAAGSAGSAGSAATAAAGFASGGNPGAATPGKMGWKPMDPEDAKRECETTKAPAACGQLASYYAAGVGVPQDRKKADELARVACEQNGEPHACHALGLLYETDQDPKTRDVPKAIALYEKSCAAGAPDGCSELGLIYFAGGRSPTGADPAKALGFVTKACELGDRMACHQAAIIKDCIAKPSSGGACNAMGKKQ